MYDDLSGNSVQTHCTLYDYNRAVWHLAYFWFYLILPDFHTRPTKLKLRISPTT